MITKKDIKCLKGKTDVSYHSTISLETFMDIYDDDSEWNNMDDLVEDIKEFLYDNIEQMILHDYNSGINQIGFTIKINGVKYDSD